MTLNDSRRFWNEKAKENPYWYVSSYGPYSGRNLADFWESGAKVWEDLKTTLAYSPVSSDVVVEIGCGVGRLSRAIAPEVSRLHAIDISDEMLTLARNEVRRSNVIFHHGDGESLRPIPDAAADLVLAYCVFQHLPSTDTLLQYLSEMQRVAKPGGLVAFTLTRRTWHVYAMPLLRAKRWIKERCLPDGPRELYRHEWVGIRPTPDSIRHLSSVPLALAPLHNDKWLLTLRTPL
jgi:SAM-dependent methyltransferase